MTFYVSRSEVFQALSQVRHPEIQSRNLVELGMIPKVILFPFIARPDFQDFTNLDLANGLLGFQERSWA